MIFCCHDVSLIDFCKDNRLTFYAFDEAVREILHLQYLQKKCNGVIDHTRVTIR